MYIYHHKARAQGALEVSSHNTVHAGAHCPSGTQGPSGSQGIAFESNVITQMLHNCVADKLNVSYG